MSSGVHQRKSQCPVMNQFRSLSGLGPANLQHKCPVKSGVRVASDLVHSVSSAARPFSLQHTRQHLTGAQHVCLYAAAAPVIKTAAICLAVVAVGAFLYGASRQIGDNYR